MPDVEVNLFALAVFLEDAGGYTSELCLEWAHENGLRSEHIDSVWDALDADDGQQFIRLCHDMSSIVINLDGSTASNTWMIPESFIPVPNKAFTKFLVTRLDVTGNRYVYTTEGELLVPAPYGAKPRRRNQHGWHFLLGLASGEQSLCGVVEEGEPHTAKSFLNWIASSECSAAMAGLSERDVSFYLERLSKLPLQKKGAVTFTEASVAQSTTLRVTKILTRP